MNFTFTRGGGGRADRSASAKGLFLGSVAAVCLLAMLGLASCGGNDGGSTQAQAQTPMNMMNGYFLTQNADGDIECLSEDLTMMENMDGTVSASSVFGSTRIKHMGYKAENDKSDTEILGLGYAAFDSDGSSNIRNPGIYYFQRMSNGNLSGLWIGQPNMPMSEDAREGMICPYIMVPDPDEVNAQEAGCPSDIEGMLGNVCYQTNDMGFVDPTPVQKASDDQ